VIRTIQSTWPETKITWVIGKTEYELLKNVNDVEFITFDKSQGVASYLSVRKALKGRRFPILVHMHASMRANLVSRMIRADVRLGFDMARARDRQWLFTNRKIPARPGQHVMDGLFEFIETLGIAERTLRWDIPISESDRQLATDLTAKHHPVCVISPCSSQRFRNYRNWAVENYVAVVKHLHERYGAHVILTGGSTDTEMDYGKQIQFSASDSVTNLIGQTTLKQLLAIIECADLVICPDSGPAHMATAVGTPVIGLYATSNTHRTGPYFSQHLVVDRYPEAVRREFDKPVESLRWGQRVRNPNAMQLIHVDDVLAKIAIVLGSSGVPESNSPDDRATASEVAPPG
jgi:heptosyltransferase I